MTRPQIIGAAYWRALAAYMAGQPGRARYEIARVVTRLAGRGGVA